MKWAVSIITMGLLGTAAGCENEPTGPAELASIYEIQTADSRSLPVRSFRTISNDAGTCVYDLVGGNLSFSGNGTQYGLSFSYHVQCLGAALRVEHHSMGGTWTRNGDELALTPKIASTFIVERAQLRGDGIDLSVRTTAGDEHDFRFIAIHFD